MPLLVALSLALFPSLVGCQGSNADTARVRGWQRDLDSVVSTARRVHASPLRPAHAPAFDEAANRLAAHIPDLPDSRVMVELQRLLAILGDGHSLVYPVAGPRASFDMLPVDVWLFEDGLFIVGGVASARDLVGSKVLRIGSLSTEQVLSRMAPYVSRDNAMGLKAFASLYLILPGFLAAWGATENLHQVSLTLVDTLGQTSVVRLEAGASRRIAKRLHPPPHTRSPSPLYLREAERPFWITHLSDAHALFFQFNQVSDTPDRTIAQFARMLTDTLRSLAASRLIIDVRHNTGGNNQLLSPLVNAITSYAAGDTARRLYVLTSRSTFSAAQNFINRVERSTPTAIFAGEPSMSSPNFTGEDNPFRLPFSGLVVSISNRYWQDSRADDRRPWIAPHLPVALQSTDWLHNADPVLDAVLRDIYSSRRGGSPKQ